TVGDRRMGLWDVATGKEILGAAGLYDPVEALQFSGGGKELVSAGIPDRTGTREVRRWDTQTWRPQANPGPKMPAVVPEKAGDVARSPDGRFSASWDARDKVVRVRDLARDREHLRLRDQAPDHLEALNPVLARTICLAFSPDGRTLAIGNLAG